MNTKTPAMKSAGKTARKAGHNVVELVTKKKTASAAPAAGASADFAAHTAGRSAGVRAITERPDDERVKEAMRLAQAFLAIEDAGARAALVALAERLVSYDWIRKVR